MHHLVYLHGFLSSSLSVKAQQTRFFANKHFPSLNVHIPELSGSIQTALTQLISLINTLPLDRTCFIGSSMGGYLSSYLVEKYAKAGGTCKAVLVNPAVEPFTLLGNYLGKHINPYTGEVFFVTVDDLQILRDIYQLRLHDKSRYKVLLQTGDTTLDYRLATKKYGLQQCIVEQGGDHSFQDFDRHLPTVFKFLLK